MNKHKQIERGHRKEILNIKGIIYDIQYYSIHDGPGIRTLVFLKGCPLSCKWCCNPESQIPTPQLNFNTNKCIGCHICISKCPEGALNITSGCKVIVNFKKCKHCGSCVEYCNTQALKMIGEEKTVEGIIREVEKDRIFYQDSGGGVTLSGGEVLTQPEFAKALLQGCLEQGIETAIETSGYGEWEDFKRMLPYARTILYDLKCINPQKHRNLTGVDNERILINLRFLDAKENTPYIIRIPVIPKHNTDDKTIKEIGEFIQNLHRLKVIHLLPYHCLGNSKYGSIGRKYSLTDLRPPEDEQLIRIAEKLANYGVTVQIGG